MRTNEGMKKRHHQKQNRRKVIAVICILAALLIIFCGASTVQVQANEESSPQRYKYYTSVYVDRDDTLWDISSEYMSAEYKDIQAYMDEVKSINHLSDDQLQYGTTICVPYYSDEYK